MPDSFSNFSSGLTSPATRLEAIIPSDTADIPNASRAINVANSGTVQVTTVGGDTATIFVAAGVAFPVRATRVWATGTNATGIVMMF